MSTDKSYDVAKKEIGDDEHFCGEEIDEKYPQGRINIADGTVQYQPGAPTRKQQEEMQAQERQQAQSSDFKVVKE